MLKVIGYIVIGSLIGYFQYRLIGCTTGSCPLTSNPLIATIYGGIIGFLFSTIK